MDEVNLRGAGVPLFVESNNPRVMPSPFGCGVLLMVERGIKCADNVQVVSYSTDNALDIEDIAYAVESCRSDLKKLYALIPIIWGITRDESLCVGVLYRMAELIGVKANRHLEETVERL